MLSSRVLAQDVALKTNGLYWLTTTPNLGLELALNDQWTLDLSAAYNPWTFKDDKKMRFWLAQPDSLSIRYFQKSRAIMSPTLSVVRLFFQWT